MKLYICEKPSLAKAVFIGLGGQESTIREQQRNGFFKIGDHVVTFCFGHMLELLDPEDHNPKYEQWNMDDLPFRFPPKLKVKPEAKKQYSVISSLIKQCSTIIHTGDNDEEGQLLIDEILAFENNTKPVKRLLIADMTEEAINKSLNSISDNSLYEHYGKIALARSISDQMYGYNLTRAYTLAGQKKGLSGTINIGRVQTNIVNLINERCEQVENYKESFYYNIYGNFNCNGINFKAKYINQENDNLNEDGHIVDKNIADNIKDKAKGKATTIVEANHREKEKQSPMPYTMATLQSDCARKFGITAKETLEAAQALYEKHKLITYPRSNCKYLGDFHFEERHKVIKAIAETNKQFSNFVSGATSNKPHPCFNSKKIGAHYGIIPTIKSANFEKLSDLERKIYNLIARSYIALIFPKSRYKESVITLNVDGLSFTVKSESLISQGWEVLYTNDKDNPDVEKSESSEQDLTKLDRGQTGSCIDAEVQTKKSPKPKYFVESTLLRAMTHVAPYIEDDDLRDIMNAYFKDKNIPAELGTEATRADVIDKVFDSGLAVKEKEAGYKELAMKTTPLGKQLMSVLPPSMRKVDLTASWVRMGADIKESKLSVDSYVDSVYRFIQKQVEHLKTNGLDISLDSAPCPNCTDGLLKRIKTAKGFFFGCSNHPLCSATFPDYNGKPFTNVYKCPDCSKEMILRKGSNGYFFGCSGYSEGCQKTMPCVNGKPSNKPVKRKPTSRRASTSKPRRRTNA